MPHNLFFSSQMESKFCEANSRIFIFGRCQYDAPIFYQNKINIIVSFEIYHERQFFSRI